MGFGKMFIVHGEKYFERNGSQRRNFRTQGNIGISRGPGNIFKFTKMFHFFSFYKNVKSVSF